jgi:hypothetical protein
MYALCLLMDNMIFPWLRTSFIESMLKTDLKANMQNEADSSSCIRTVMNVFDPITMHKRKTNVVPHMPSLLTAMANRMTDRGNSKVVTPELGACC